MLVYIYIRKASAIHPLNRRNASVQPVRRRRTRPESQLRWDGYKKAATTITSAASGRIRCDLRHFINVYLPSRIQQSFHQVSRGLTHPRDKLHDI